MDPELKNRCITLSVDEERTQTRAIHEAQRRARTLEGKRESVGRRLHLKLHHNVQRCLRPVGVLNPYASSLTFLDVSHGLRRDQMKYLNLIDVIAYLHQYQRPQKRDSILGEYIEVIPMDIQIANALAHEVLGRSLDELAPQSRRLLLLIYSFVEAECKKRNREKEDFRFTRWDLRAVTKWSDTALKVHLRRLCDLEYLAVHRGVGQSFVYELFYRGEGEEGNRFALGLIDSKGLSHAYDARRSGEKEKWSGPGQGPVSPQSGGGPDSETSLLINKENAQNDLLLKNSENAYQEKTNASYRKRNPIPLVAVGAS